MKHQTTNAHTVLSLLTARVTKPTSALAIVLLLAGITTASASEKPATLSDVAKAWSEQASAKAQEIKADVARKAVCKGLEILVTSDSATVAQTVYFRLTCGE